jgi:hypothetical protein
MILNVINAIILAIKLRIAKVGYNAPMEKHIVVNNTTKVWKKKQEKGSQEECDLAMHAQDKESYWYIDNGCSKHMTGDQNKFLKLKKEKGGSVSFGDNKSAKIIGKGKVSLGSQNATTKMFF